MKKHLFNSFILLCLFLCMSFLVTSCDSFLTAEETRNQIQDAIEYANAKTCKLYMKTDTDMGVFLSESEKECKLGYSTEISFKLKKDAYVFNSFSAVSVANESESRAEYVQFTYNEEKSDIDKGIYYFSVKLLKEANDIYIVPSCFLLPKVVSYSPDVSNSNFANVPIVINFNTQMDTELVNEKISINFNDIDRKETLFDSFIWNEEKNKLTIYPDAIQLKNFILKTDAAFLDFKIVLPETITVKKGNTVLNLVQDKNSQLVVRYAPAIEEIAPAKNEFFVTRHLITLDNAAQISREERFNQEDIVALNIAYKNDELSYEEKKSMLKTIYQNRTNGEVYIYGEYYDNDSGVQTITVREQRKTGWDSELVEEREKISEFSKNSSGISFETVNGITRFCIPYQIASGDGAVLLDITVSDACNNTSESQKVTAIKKSECIIGDGLKYDGFKINSNFAEPDLVNFDIDTFNESLKTIEYYAYYCDCCDDNDICVLYKIDDNYGVLMNPSEVKCEYDDENGVHHEQIISCYEHPVYGFYNFDVDDIEGTWSGYTTLEVESIAGLEILMTITDGLGNVVSKTYRLPSANEVSYQITKNADNTTGEVSFSHIYDEGLLEGILQIKQDSQGNIVSCEFDWDTEFEIEAGYDYRMSACIGGVFTEITDMTYSLSTTPPTNLGNVVLASVPYEITKVTKQRDYFQGAYLGITVKVQPKSETVNNYTDMFAVFNYKPEKVSWEKRQYFEKDATELTFEIPTKALYNADVDITVYGVRDQAVTSGTSITIDQIIYGTPDFTLYDNIPPLHAITYDEDYFFADDTDFGSGLNYAKYIFADRPDNVYEIHFWNDVDNVYYDYSVRKIPISAFYIDGQEEYSYSYEVYDKALNCVKSTMEKIYFYDNPAGDFVKLTKNDDDEWVLSTDIYTTARAAVAKSHINIYAFYSDNTWHECSSIYQPAGNNSILSVETVEDASGNAIGKKTVLTNPTLVGNQFIKVIVYSRSGATYNSAPGYFWTGSAGTGNYDMLLSTGFNDSVAICSDNPVLVHTMVTDRPYEECKNWSIHDWERYKKTVNEVQMTFSADEHNIKPYNIDMDKIKDNECYVVIAHFAKNNKVTMSSVMQK